MAKKCKECGQIYSYPVNSSWAGQKLGPDQGLCHECSGAYDDPEGFIQMGQEGKMDDLIQKTREYQTRLQILLALIANQGNDNWTVEWMKIKVEELTQYVLKGK